MYNLVTKFEKVIHKLRCEDNLKKQAFIDPNIVLTYEDLYNNMIQLANSIIEKTNKNDVVGIVTNRGVVTIVAMLACIYANTPYVILDVESPLERIHKIIDICSPKLLIFDDDNQNKWNALKHISSLCVNLNNDNIICNQKKLDGRIDKIVATDPVYILFTSGSTGTPKGTVINHINIMSYIEWFTSCFHINEKTIFASQTPFYFSMSVSDVFSTILTGASLYIVPKSYFSFPVKLIEVMNHYQVNTIYWVPSAYQIISQMKLLDYVLPNYLKLAMFAGEVMPTKILNYWVEKLPNVEFVNLFGPTETTDICTYYKVNRKFMNDEILPIGNACKNLEVFLMNEKGQLASYDEEGELYVKGPFVAMGYYGNPEKTADSFVQNPIHNNYKEVVYKTGDICKYNEYNELIYLCRKDFQIKHMGYRIELGEIETLCNSLDEIKNAFCLYDTHFNEIICCYVGNLDSNDLKDKLKRKMPYYMLPSKYEQLKTIRLNQNGKIDRKFYQEQYVLSK